MPLRGPRFSGDPVLERCLSGEHRMLAGEKGLAVMRVQSALVELGVPIGPSGLDGIFGLDTGAAVTAYKTGKGLVPNDPVVGPGTSKALDDDLFVDPPTLDPAFAEFSPSVVEHRVEPFVGRELASLIGAPMNSWRRMVALFALGRLSSGELLGAVAVSRADQDMRDRYTQLAAPVQPDGVGAVDRFNAQIQPGNADARTVSFLGTDGGVHSFVWVNDDIIMGRGFVKRTSTQLRARVTLLGVLMHELNHVRNLGDDDFRLARTPDTDAAVYVDPTLAQASTASGGPTVEVLRSFVREMCARHLHWIADREAAGDPFAARFLPPEKLVEATRFYIMDTDLFHQNGYLPGLIAQGLSTVYAQMARWLRICQTFSFSDDPLENTRTRALFGDAATVAEDLAGTPPTDFPEADGLFPLEADFTL